MLTRALVLPAVAALIAAGASIARAEDIFVPRDHASIGDAMAAAQAGDRIVVVGGRHRRVVVDKDGLTLVGRGATLTGETWIIGAGVRVSGFRFAGEGRVIIAGDDAVFDRNAVARHTLVAVEGGDRARLERNSLAPAGITIHWGDDVVVRRNRFPRTGELISGGSDTLIEANRVGSVITSGPRPVVRSNRTLVLRSYGDGVSYEGNVSSRFLQVNGNDAVIRGNRARSIGVFGDDATVAGNEVGRSALGILVSGSRATVAGNVVTAGSMYPQADFGAVPNCPGIQVDATEPGGVVEDNDVTHVSGTGIVIHADGVTVTGNTVNGVSSMTSVEIVGDFNVVSDNAITQTQNLDAGGDGIVVGGDVNVVRDNTISGVAADAVVVTGLANSITGDVIENAGGCGVLVTTYATGTIVTDCTVTGCSLGVANRSPDATLTGSTIDGSEFADVLDLGAFLLFEDNVYGTLSHDRLLDPQR